MKLLLIRDIFTDKSTVGKLYVDGNYECYTLEDVVRDIKIDKITAIPAGTYEVIIDISTRFKKEMPRLLNVPNFRGVRIHSGNTAEDTEGCILVGKNKLQDRVVQSYIAFNLLFDKLERAYDKNEPITIEIKNGQINPK